MTTTMQPTTDRLDTAFPNIRDLWWISDAQPGTPNSQRPVDDDAHLAGITVVESAGRRLAVCTDTHRLHAVTVTGRPRVGIYTSHSGSYRLDRTVLRPSLTEQWIHKLRETLDELQQPTKPHPVTVRIGQRHRDDLLEAINRHPASVIVFRTRSITLHDVDTDELLETITGAASFSDRLRDFKLATIRASVIRRPLAERITVYTGTGQISPLIGHRRNRFAVLMPTRPSTGVSMLYDSTGQPIGHNATKAATSASRSIQARNHATPSVTRASTST